MATLFISDLHLSGEQPTITENFIRFLNTEARSADALYILGDLFEAWLGDDMILPVSQQALAEIKAMSHNDVPVYFMHDNRDFLIGNTFCELSGATLLNDPTVIDLYALVQFGSARSRNLLYCKI